MIETITSSSSLAARLRKRISREGPLTFCEWMKAALYDPSEGYYCRSDRVRWGREGDYRTSPERSSLFAATFARYFDKLHEHLGRPSTWTILEAGAGEGHFAAGLLRTLQKFFPEVYAATSYVIDEVSPQSCQRARERLQLFADRIHFRNLDQVEIDHGVVFSNELLDAFPIHRMILRDGEFKEFHVTVGEDGSFQWLVATPSAALLERLKTYFDEVGMRPVEGRVVEVGLEIEEWLRRVAARIRAGYVVTVDYGANTEDLDSRNDGTLRGFQRHQFVDDLLAQPGEQDLTTTINWDFVKSAGATVGLGVVELSRLDQFLLKNGFIEQLEVESSQAEDEAERLRLTTTAREMILPSGMAASFQVLVQKKISQ